MQHNLSKSFALLAFLLIFSFLKGHGTNNPDLLTEFKINSKKVKMSLDIRVSLPDDYDESRTYNTIYLLDANYFFDEKPGSLDDYLTRGDGMSNIVKRLMKNGDIPPTILIGIGYTERQRSFLTMKTTEAFHEFFAEELIPRIESSFNVGHSADDRLLFGYSASAHFSTYALMKETDQQSSIFNQFISISGVYFDDMSAYQTEEKISYKKDPNAFEGKSLYLVIGNKDPKADLLQAHRNFTKKLRKRKYTGLKLYTSEIKNHGHYDIPEYAFEEGLKWIHKK